MRGEKIRLNRRLESLQKAAEKGNIGAAGEARLLATWLNNEEARYRKRQDDRCKILVGAMLGTALKSGQAVTLNDHPALLDALSVFLVRHAERDAVLGEDGAGSPAFHRVFGAQSAAKADPPNDPNLGEPEDSVSRS